MRADLTSTNNQTSKRKVNHSPAGRNIRLVFFSFGILEQAGGFEHYLTSTARGLSERYKDLDITIVTMDPKIVEKLQHLFSLYFFRKHDPKAIYKEPYEAVRKKLGPVKYVRASSLKGLTQLLQDGDLIYSKNEVLELVMLKCIGFKKLPPVIIGVHTPIFYPNTPSLSSRLHNLVYTGPIYRKLIKHLNSIQVHNKDDLELVRTKLGFANTKIVKQPFEIPELKDTAPHPGKLRLLFVGRLTEAKGIDLLIKTIKKLDDTNPNTFIIKIAGAGDMTTVNEIKQLAQHVKAVEYLGHIQNEKIFDLYKWTDVTLITSKYETLNKVAIETAAAGKIAISTDIPGPREVIQNDITGFLLPPEPEAFVQCIAQLVKLKEEDVTASKKMGRAAYQYVKSKFNAEDAYHGIHEEVVKTAGVH